MIQATCYVVRCNGAPIVQPATTKFGGPTKVVTATYTPNPSCIPNLKLPASIAAEINRGSQSFWMFP